MNYYDLVITCIINLLLLGDGGKRKMTNLGVFGHSKVGYYLVARVNVKIQLKKRNHKSAIVNGVFKGLIK